MILFFIPLHDVFWGTVGNFLDTYSIHFKGLKIGKHLFNFEVDKRFFDEFDESEIKEGKLQVAVKLNKQSRMLDLKISIEGYVEVICDRCLDNFNLPTSFNGSLYVKFGEEEVEEGDEIIILSNDESELNLAQYIYESICLSLPYQRHHGVNGSDSNCNKEMIKKLKNHTAAGTKKVEKSDIDPRWDKLKDIKLN